MVNYADTGVDRELRKEAKKRLDFKSTFVHSKHGKIIETPFNMLYPISDSAYQVKTSDGIGTKVLIAELAEKHDTIGIDAVAMVVNDCIRCGARPIAITDTIDIRKSLPEILQEIQKGLNRGANEAECPIVGGETADVPDIMKALYHINCDCVGEVMKEKIITGKRIESGDVIIGIRSSGVHSNGISLLRRTLFKQWGGRYDAFENLDGFDNELVFEALEPTKIYVKPFLKLAKNIDVLGAVHITGDAYLKFGKITNLGFEFDNFKPQPIFDLINK
jgi:phosphoribosylformylglycinamidine cyclo-ligase